MERRLPSIAKWRKRAIEQHDDVKLLRIYICLFIDVQIVFKMLTVAFLCDEILGNFFFTFVFRVFSVLFGFYFYGEQLFLQSEKENNKAASS